MKSFLSNRGVSIKFNVKKCLYEGVIINGIGWGADMWDMSCAGRRAN